MAVTLEQVMRECNNYFERCRYFGSIRVVDGKIAPDVGSPYVFISGGASLYGVYSLVNGRLVDAEDVSAYFTGTLWFLYPPKGFTDIAEEIAEFATKSPVGGFASESFGQYSYSRATGSKGLLTWQEAFSDRLRPYRQMFTEVG